MSCFYDQNSGVVQTDSTFVGVIENGSDVATTQVIYRVTNTGGRYIYISNSLIYANGLQVACTANTVYLISHILDRTGSTQELIVTEAGQSDNNDSDNSPPAQPANWSIVIGASNTAGAAPFLGKVGEMIVLNGVAAADLLVGNNYLKSRYLI